MFEREPGHSPERALWVAVLAQAIEDAMVGPGGSFSPDQRLVAIHNARAYVTTPSRDLAQVCNGAGIDPQAFLERMKRRLADAPSPEELLADRKTHKPKATPKPKSEKVIPFRSRPVTIDGQTKTVTEWCEIAGIAVGTAHSRTFKGWSIEDAVTITRAQVARDRQKVRAHKRLAPVNPQPKPKPAPKGIPAKTYTHDNRTMTIRQWADHVGMSWKTLRGRLDKGWSFPDAISTEVITPRKAAA